MEKYELTRFHFVGVSSTQYNMEFENFTSSATDEDMYENSTDLEDRESLPGFGSAHVFIPIPDSGTVVAAHCAWQFRYNYVENRIPRKYILSLPN